MARRADYVSVNPSTHALARAQAQSLAAQAVAVGVQAKNAPAGRGTGHVLSFLVLAGLSIELYLKAFMIAARSGHVRKGHDLAELLSEFPPHLKAEFEVAYSARMKLNDGTYKMVALQISPTPPSRPSDGGPNLNFSTFEDSLTSLALCFVDARYMFESVKSGAWTYVSFPHDQVLAVLEALEKAYIKLEASGYGKNG